MSIKFKINQRMLEDTEQFFKVIESAVFRAANSATKKYADSVRRDWRKSSTSNNVPGNFSKGWKDFKKSRGLKTEHLQRFGRGDKRSMYENIEIKPLSPNGYFVGILSSAKSFDIDGKVKSKSLADVAEELEERFPLWRDILERSPKRLKKFLKEEIVREFRKLGAKDAE